MARDWTPGDAPEIEVVPGITAVNAVSSLLGAPLSHDFCSISLSDLLTPWDVIEKRLEAAARGDFIVGLYNPKSGRRTQQIIKAREIFLKHRSPDTPVGLVKSAFRKRQRIDVGNLENMLNFDIGMLSTVIIGNNSTLNYKGLLITPRGYARKYDLQNKQVKEGISPKPLGGNWSLSSKE
jgi:precorrin-3B C17-methyltransferase